MSFIKSKGFKYIKNLLIGVGAATVLVGALAKLESWSIASTLLQIGLFVEAGIFLFLGIIGPDKDYYWEKLYPGLDNYNSKVDPLSGPVGGAQGGGLSGEVVEQQLGGMLTELQSMSRSLSSLKALQEVDFSGTQEQVKQMTNFYSRINEAMVDLSDTLDDTKRYKEQLSELNNNIGSLNNAYSSLNAVYGNIISAMTNANRGA